MLISIHGSDLRKVAWIDNDKPYMLNYFDDVWTRYLETGSSIFEFTVYKKAVKSDLGDNRAYKLLNDKAFVSFKYKGRSYVFSVMQIDEDEITMYCVCENLNLELINEYSNPYKASKAMTFSEYCKAMDLLNFSLLQIGRNEVEEKKLTLEWEGTETKLARLLSLAVRFDAELEFETRLRYDSTIKSFLVHVYKSYDGVTNNGVGQIRSDISLVYGKNLRKMTRKIDKTGIFNAVRATGKRENDEIVTIAGASEIEIKNSKGQVEFYQKDEMLYAPLSMQRYPSAFTSETTNDQWIRKDMTVESDNPTVIRSAALASLRKNAYPAITYELDGWVDADIGDTVKITDNGFTPTLIVQARVFEQSISFTKPSRNKTVFANAKALENQLSDDAQGAIKRMIEELQPYSIRLATTNGVMFKNGQGTSTVIPSLYRGIKQITGATWRYLVNGEETQTGAEYVVNASSIGSRMVLTVCGYIGNAEVFRDNLTFTNVSDGERGKDGAQGPKGDKGEKGDPGQRGLDGLQGSKGDQGVPGARGVDGKTSYTHIAYATNAAGTAGFSVTDSVGKTYIGIYVDQVATDSADPTRYKWTLIKGADGSQGIPGAKGADGRTPYLHIAYANNSTGTAGFSTTDSAGRTYIGQYTDYTAADSTNQASYKWTLIKGEKGDKGDPGQDGLPGAPGVGIKSTVSTYGLSANETTQPTSWSASVPTLVKGQYLWTKTVWTYTDNSTETGYQKTYISKDGNNGTNGIAGKDGVGIRTTTVVYAGSTSGTVPPTSGWSSQIPSVSPGQYLWTKTTWTYTDNTTETGYSVAKMGDTGASAYFYVAYADSPNGSTGFSISDASKRYMGHYSSSNPTQSTSAASYKWIDRSNVTATFVQSTAPANPPTGSRWKYTGSTVITANSSTITPGEQYLFIGARWVKDVITSDNLQIKNEFINGPMIKNGAVTVDKLSVGDLSAISANLGSVTAGKMLLQRSFGAGSSAVPVYNYPAFKTGLFIDDYGLIVNGAPVQKSTTETTATDMPVVAVTSGEIRFMRTNLTDNIEEVLHTGLSDPDFGYIQFGRDSSGKNALIINANGQIYLKGENYTDWAVSTIDNRVKWKVQGNLVIVDYDLSFTSGGNKQIITIPTKYVPKALMLAVSAWYALPTKDKKAQLNADGGLHILDTEANQRYCGQIIWAY